MAKIVESRFVVVVLLVVVAAFVVVGVLATGNGGVALTSSVEPPQRLVYLGDGSELTLADVSGQQTCLLYTSPSPRDQRGSRMPSSA